MTSRRFLLVSLTVLTTACSAGTPPPLTLAQMPAFNANRALDDIRRVKASGAVAFSEDFEPVAETEHPLDGRERGEALARLMKCLDGLDDEKREIILLAYYRGVTREALAGRFGRPVPTIKTWLHRGLAQLRECLSS